VLTPRRDADIFARVSSENFLPRVYFFPRISADFAFANLRLSHPYFLFDLPLPTVIMLAE
jgi:hypothetical protein